MRLGFVPIHIKIARRFGHLQDDTLHGGRDRDLTSQATGFGQTKGHVQHIFFVLGRLGQLIVQVGGQNQMASTTRTHCVVVI